MYDMQNQLIFRFTNKKLINGIFLKRLNRFVVECLIDGEKHLAHLPNPGRLWELLFKGSRILLYENKVQNRNLFFTVVAVYKDSKPILLHTIQTNSVAEWIIKNKVIRELEDFNIVSREKVLNNSRIDFHLSNGERDLYLEVKSCTLFKGKIAMFPDAITKRGTKHLNELAQLKSQNTQGGILFLVQSGDVEYFLPEYHTDLKFAQSFINLSKNLIFFVYKLNWTDELELNFNQIEQVKIPFEILENEINDSGSYILIIYNRENQKIKIGNLGNMEFRKGYYCYIGSALQFLSKRIERHKRKIKTLHWHIDYLVSKTKIIKSIEIRTPDKIECEIAHALEMISETSMKNFGSSDCNCNSHLFYFKENPILRKDFIELILHFRMERLIEKYNL